MRPEAEIEAPSLGGPDEIERLARTLLDLAGDQNVRVIEAVAAALANRGQESTGNADLDSGGFLAEPAACFVPEATVPLEVCRRIARRALRGSLSDPTEGATAFHRVDDNPDWSRAHLPIAVAGPFLFYQA